MVAFVAVQSDRTDIELVEGWRRGDRAAGSQLFERHYDAVARFFANKVGAGHRQELIQRTFLGCVEARDRFRGDARFTTYLLGIARRQLYKHYDRTRRDAARLDYQRISAVALDPSPSQVVADREEQRLLLEALRAIPLDYQVILELVYWENMTAAEAAMVLELPVGTAKTRIRRGRQLVEHELRALEANAHAIESTITDLQAWASQLRGALTEVGTKGP